MTRKKTTLWLHKPKKKYYIASVPKTRTLSQVAPFLSPSRASTDVPDSSGSKRIVTPLRGTTPKWQRIYSPLCGNFLTGEEFGNFTSPKTDVENETNQLTENDRLSSVLHKLKDTGIAKEFETFIDLVERDKFPLDNIAMKLFMETVRFLSLKRKSEMTYCNETKRFWKIRYRLFHGNSCIS